MISQDGYTLKEEDGRWISVFFQNGRTSAAYGDTEEDAIEKSWKIMKDVEDQQINLSTAYGIVLDMQDETIVGPVMQEQICKALGIKIEDFYNALDYATKNMSQV